MASILQHRDIVAMQNHVLQGWEVANATARLALVPVAADVGRIAHQADDSSSWVCTSATPVRWRRLDVAAGDTEIYVNAATGNDANNGLTANTALQTVEAALDKMPVTWTGKQRIYIAAGTYTITRNNIFTGIAQGSNPEPFLLIGEMIDSGLGTRIVGSGSTATVINVTGANMIADAHYGARIRFLTGANAGQTRHIVANTINSITVNVGGWSAPSASDTFVVERPGTVINYSDIFSISSAGYAPYYPTSSTRCSVGMYGIKWVAPAGRGWFQFQGGSTWGLADACEWWLGGTSNNKVLVNDYAKFGTAGLSFSWAGVSNSTFGVIFISGNFPGTRSSNLSMQCGGQVFNQSSVIGDNISLDVNSQSFALYAYVYLRSGFIVVEDQSTMWFYGSATIDGRNQVANGVQCTRSTLNGLNANIINCTSDAVVVTQGQLVNTGTVTGSGNSGYGIRLKEGAIAVIPSAVTVTGNLGDMVIGDTITTHNNLTSLGFVTNTNFLCRISRT